MNGKVFNNEVQRIEMNRQDAKDGLDPVRQDRQGEYIFTLFLGVLGGDLCSAT